MRRIPHCPHCRYTRDDPSRICPECGLPPETARLRANRRARLRLAAACVLILAGVVAAACLATTVELPMFLWFAVPVTPTILYALWGVEWDETSPKRYAGVLAAGTIEAVLAAFFSYNVLTGPTDAAYLLWWKWMWISVAVNLATVVIAATVPWMNDESVE